MTTNVQTRDDLPQFFIDMGYKVGAEIGVWKGEFSEKFLQAGLTMYAVDPWMPFKGQGRHQRFPEIQDSYYQVAVKRLSQYPDCVIIRKTSMDAVEDFRDRSLDFVYIDGNHSFRYFAEDLHEWSQKVRPGGCIAGHDYFDTAPWATNIICHVKTVVDAYVELFQIKGLCIIGDSDHRTKSWLWIKE